MRVFLLGFFIFFFLFSSSVLAQERVSTTSANTSKPIEYALPYPGILPTSPFYPFKMLRDHVIGYLISDPLKKAEFSLLQADKRLQAGVALLLEDKNKSELAFSTISKGENHFTEAFKQVEEAKRQKKDIYDMGVRLSVAARKHEEVLKSISSSVPPSEKRIYEKELSRVREYIKKAKPLMVR